MMEKLTAISIPNGYARDEISEISDFALRPLGGPLSSPTGWVFVTGRTHARSVCRGSAGNRCLRQVRQDERRHGDCSLAILGGFPMMDEFSIPSVVEWDYPKDARPPQRTGHFDCDHKPLADLSGEELTALAREEAREKMLAARRCRGHLRDLIRWHGKSGYR
jgi:hypothetical protein